VKFLGEKAMPLLKKNGARVDEAGRIARFPEEMVKETLGLAPR
jgi:trimethylamine:corrinoid methyltransferase-like protein